MSKSKWIETKALRAILEAAHPDLFNLDHPLPLKIGIHFDIFTHFPELRQGGVINVLRWVTCRRAYLAACACPGALRYGLDGPSGEISEKHATRARLQFVERNARAVDPWPPERFAA